MSFRGSFVGTKRSRELDQSERRMKLKQTLGLKLKRMMDLKLKQILGLKLKRKLDLKLKQTVGLKLKLKQTLGLKRTLDLNPKYRLLPKTKHKDLRSGWRPTWDRIPHVLKGID